MDRRRRVSANPLPAASAAASTSASTTRLRPRSKGDRAETEGLRLRQRQHKTRILMQTRPLPESLTSAEIAAIGRLQREVSDVVIQLLQISARLDLVIGLHQNPEAHACRHCGVLTCETTASCAECKRKHAERTRLAPPRPHLPSRQYLWPTRPPLQPMPPPRAIQRCPVRPTQVG